MASNITPSEFLDLTLPQVYILISQTKKQKKEKSTLAEAYKDIFEYRRVSHGPGSKTWEAVQKKFPTDEDKRRYYGIWPFS